jgi:hypothetical protein
MANRSPIYFAITIDTECDKGPQWLIQRPLAYRSVLHGIPERLEPLFRSAGAPATYLLSPEVMEIDACVEVFNDAARHGAELGTHLHGEFIEPMSDINAAKTAMMQNSYPREVEAEKLRNLTDLFVRKFGYQPTSFRAGRFGIGRHSLPILAELGYTVDSSVAPFTHFRDEGGEVSFYGAPVQPYFPDRNDFLRRGSMPILEVPVTIGDTLWSALPSGILRTVPNYPRLWRMPYKLLKQQLRPTWLRPTWSSVEKLKSLIEGAVRNAGRSPVFLIMMLHNVEVEPACSPYAQTERDVENYLRRMKEVIDHVASISGEFITLSEVPALLEKSEVVHAD